MLSFAFESSGPPWPLRQSSQREIKTYMLPDSQLARRSRRAAFSEYTFFSTVSGSSTP